MTSYDKSYLDDAMDNLGSMFDYSVNVLHCDADSVMERFLISGLAEKFGRGDCKIVAGYSGTELSRETLRQSGWTEPFAEGYTSISSPEYWAGWSLAYYQWYCGQTFRELNKRGIRLSDIIAMYYPMHEADLSSFCDRMETIYPRKYSAAEHMRNARKESGLTQARLAELSGIPIRLIRAYEQGAIDPMRGEYRTIAALEKALRIRLLS